MSIAPRHDHVYLGEGHGRNERRTWLVIALCSAMMVVEIVGGLLYGSIALVADGLRMSRNAGAMLLIGYESIARLFAPEPIGFTDAIPIAVLGLRVNVVSASYYRDRLGRLPSVSHLTVELVPAA